MQFSDYMKCFDHQISLRTNRQISGQNGAVNAGPDKVKKPSRARNFNLHYYESLTEPGTSPAKCQISRRVVCVEMPINIRQEGTRTMILQIC